MTACLLHAPVPRTRWEDACSRCGRVLHEDSGLTRRLVFAAMLIFGTLAGLGVGHGQALDSEAGRRGTWDGTPADAQGIAQAAREHGWIVWSTPEDYVATLDQLEAARASAVEWEAAAVAGQALVTELRAQVATLEADRARLMDALAIRDRGLARAEKLALGKRRPQWARYLAAAAFGYVGNDIARRL